jgi:hypothetical protein
LAGQRVANISGQAAIPTVTAVGSITIGSITVGSIVSAPGKDWTGSTLAVLDIPKYAAHLDAIVLEGIDLSTEG